MQLGEWIRRNGYNYRTFGEEIGVSFRNVEKWSRGETLPRFEKAKLIFDFTNNEVTVMTFMKNKYNAIKQTYKGETFDSKKELNRFMELEILLRAKEISDLELHPKFDLMVNGVKIGRYTADFRYKKGSDIIVEDVKSRATKTRDYMLRKKILATYNPPIIITEV